MIVVGNLEDYITTSVENVRMNGKKLEINLDRVMHLLMRDRLVNYLVRS